jgi:hypothetical protein
MHERSKTEFFLAFEDVGLYTREADKATGRPLYIALQTGTACIHLDPVQVLDGENEQVPSRV